MREEFDTFGQRHCVSPAILRSRSEPWNYYLPPPIFRPYYGSEGKYYLEA